MRLLKLLLVMLVCAAGPAVAGPYGLRMGWPLTKEELTQRRNVYGSRSPCKAIPTLSTNSA